MPESGAVYQPTTVGYAYDTRDGSRLGIRNSFSRIMSRHKFSTRSWLEWVLLSVAVAAFIAGFTTMLVNLVSANSETNIPEKSQVNVATSAKDSTTEVKEHSDDGARASIAVGAAMMLLGLLMGFVWAWLRFFRRGKSPRSGMTSNSGQMLGGLNPSTDLLVGSTSQYGPVLTELPSQMKSKQINNLEVSTAIPLSDQEEETHTLMDDSQQATGPSTITSQIPG